MTCKTKYRFNIFTNTFELVEPFPDSTPDIVLQNVDCYASVYVGAAVIIETGTNLAKNALADSLANSNVIGICQEKISSTVCNIRVLGVSPEIFSSLDLTKEYFLSDTVDGEITTTVPTNSGHVVLKLGQPFTDKKFFVHKSTRMVRS